MIRRWLQGLPSLCIGLLFLAGCQQDTPSEPLGRGLEGAARCGDADLNREKSLFPDDERQRQVEDLCQDILAARIDADLGADQLHVLAYDGWQAGNLGDADAQDLAEFNAAVRGLDPVAALIVQEPDEQPIWDPNINISDDQNISNDEFLAIGSTTDSLVHCFGVINTIDRWCFQVKAGGNPYFFLAEAKADQVQANLGECPGTLANDCEEDVIHIDVNPDEAIFETPVDNPDTKIHVWSCVRFADGHARFGDGPDGFGLSGPSPPPELGNCGEPSPIGLSGIQRWVWAGLKPLRWAVGVGTLNAGGTGTTFARGSDIAEGEEGSIRVRDIVCEATGKYDAISDGTVCKLFLNNSLASIPNQIESTKDECTTHKTGKRKGECLWDNIPVPDDICYYAVVDKQSQTATAHHAEGNVCVGPGNPAREGETRTCTANLTTGVITCVTSSS